MAIAGDGSDHIPHFLRLNLTQHYLAFRRQLGERSNEGASITVECGTSLTLIPLVDGRRIDTVADVRAHELTYGLSSVVTRLREGGIGARDHCATCRSPEPIVEGACMPCGTTRFMGGLSGEHVMTLDEKIAFFFLVGLLFSRPQDASACRQWVACWLARWWWPCQCPQ
jgi:hypothetical protein